MAILSQAVNQLSPFNWFPQRVGSDRSLRRINAVVYDVSIQLVSLASGELSTFRRTKVN